MSESLVISKWNLVVHPRLSIAVIFTIAGSNLFTNSLVDVLSLTLNPLNDIVPAFFSLSITLIVVAPLIVLLMSE
jgi:hypothetical protein